MCWFVGGSLEVVLSDEGMRLEPPGFIWAKQEGPVSVWAAGASERRTEGASSQLTPELLPAWDLNLSPHRSVHPRSLSSPSFRSLLCILATSLPGRGLAYIYLCRAGPHLMSAVLALSHRSCACLQMAPLLNSPSVYEYTFHKQDM